MDARLAPARRSNSLVGLRGQICLGVEPPASGGGPDLDSLDRRSKINPSTLHGVRTALETGPASAVDDVDELYEAGLPRGLPGGLHLIAINERAGLLSQLARVKAARAVLVARREAPSQVSAQRAARSFGAYDAHAPVAGAGATSCVPVQPSSTPYRRNDGRAVVAAAAPPMTAYVRPPCVRSLPLQHGINPAISTGRAQRGRVPSIHSRIQGISKLDKAGLSQEFFFKLMENMDMNNIS